MFICIYSVQGEIDQISTNTSRYSTCCAANVYIFVYIFIGAPIVPLTEVFKIAFKNLHIRVAYKDLLYFIVLLTMVWKHDKADVKHRGGV